VEVGMGRVRGFELARWRPHPQSRHSSRKRTVASAYRRPRVLSRLTAVPIFRAASPARLRT
jgi:hypothetical protein